MSAGYIGPQGSTGHPQDPRRIARDLGHRLKWRQHPCPHQIQNQGQGRFQTDDAVGRQIEFGILFQDTVRRVVGGDGIDGAIASPSLIASNIGRRFEAADSP